MQSSDTLAQGKQYQNISYKLIWDLVEVKTNFHPAAATINIQTT